MAQSEIAGRVLALRLLLRRFVNTAAQSLPRTPVRLASKLRSCCRRARPRAARHTSTRCPVHCGFFPRHLSVAPTSDEDCSREDRCSDQKARISGQGRAPPTLPGKARLQAIPGMHAANRTLPTSIAETFPPLMRNVPPDLIPNRPTELRVVAVGPLAPTANRICGEWPRCAQSIPGD